MKKVKNTSKSDNKVVLDLNKLDGQVGSVVTNEVLVQFAKQATATSKQLSELIDKNLGHQLIETARIANSVSKLHLNDFNTAMVGITQAQAALVPSPNSFLSPTIEALRLVQQSQLAEVGESISKLAVNWQPLFDLRVIVGGIAAEMVEVHKKLLTNVRFDIGTMATPLQVLNGLTVGFQDTKTNLVTDDTVAVSTTSVRTFDNELVSQRQETKIDMLLAASQQQTGIIASVEQRVFGLEAIIFQLTQRGQQLFTINDFQYDDDSCVLIIKSLNEPIKITARRERQLCELLLRNGASMIKHWSIDDLLEVIGESFAQMGFDTQGWTDKFYKAAKRLNARLKPILGFDLIEVDRKQEMFYINPQFYHN